MAAIAAELSASHPETNANVSTIVTPIRERYVGRLESSLFALLAATLLVLLVTCTNVGGIQLARAVARESEIAVRSAIGASRGRVVRQLVTESLVVSFAGGV